MPPKTDKPRTHQIMMRLTDEEARIMDDAQRAKAAEGRRIRLGVLMRRFALTRARAYLKTKDAAPTEDT